MNYDKIQSIDLLESVLNVSRETIDMLEIYYHLLMKWQKVQNLVSSDTLDYFWSRHVCDSAALKELNPGSAIWLDIGSGAGFPGLVTAILQNKENDSKVYLIESNMRKVVFLRSVIRELKLNAVVVQGRIEEIIPNLDFKPDFISARAVTSLSNLLSFSQKLIQEDARCFFHKAQNIDSEIIEVKKIWNFSFKKHHALLQKISINNGVIVEIDSIMKIKDSV